MSDYYTEEIKRRMDALPADIKALVYSADMNAVIQAVGQKYQLHVDQIGALESETAGVMIGLTKPEEFAQELVDALTIDEAKAQAIVQDLNNQLFIKVRESLKKLNSEPQPSTITAPAQAPVETKIPIRVTPQITPSVAPAQPAAPVIQAAPVAPTPSPAPTVAMPVPASMPVAPKMPTMPMVETALTEPTVAIPTPKAPDAAAAQKPIYKTDPYREPVE